MEEQKQTNKQKADKNIQKCISKENQRIFMAYEETTIFTVVSHFPDFTLPTSNQEVLG